MATFFLTPDDIDVTEIDVWPDVWPAFQVFQAMYTQWRTGMGGVTGLDYNILPWLMKVHGISDEASALHDIRVMEASALRVIHKNG
ncbi:DUF1799 domain-containing protein [Erwinia typographi]|uniref:DUF1799 domain-containing protein n=1 Tax=Erwinia typographi TaxID=371042 RepID=UPI000907D613|nr:DUF1799 domain-containing protein [Erwinia typographi]